MPVNRFKYHTILLLITAIFCIQVISCKKDTVGASKPLPYFFKQFPLNFNQLSGFVVPSKDGGFLIVGSEETDDNGKFVTMLYKTDSMGNLLWQKKIFLYNDYSYPWITGLRDGNILLLDENGKMMIISPEGDIALGPVDYFIPPYNTSFGIEYNDKYFVGFSRGWQFNDDNNYIGSISKNGIKKYTRLMNASFNAHILTVNVFGVQEVSASENYYWICGQLFDKPAWQWSSTVKFYVARFKNNLPVKINILNNHVDTLGNEYLRVYTTTPDSGLVAVLGGSRPNPVLQILQYDKELNLMANKKIDLDGNFPSLYRIEKCKNGGYLLAGSVMINSTFEQPVLAKLDDNFNLLWTKVFRTKVSGIATWVQELQDGTLVLTGYTNGFGNANHANDVFLIRTNSIGELQ